MPKKLLKCIADVMATGKDKSTAIAICVKSTGLKMEKGELDKMLKEKGIVEGINSFDSKLAKLNFLETIKEENTTIGFYEYRRT